MQIASCLRQITLPSVACLTLPHHLTNGIAIFIKEFIVHEIAVLIFSTAFL
jgi:hypothetical protein